MLKASKEGFITIELTVMDEDGNDPVMEALREWYCSNQVGVLSEL